MKTHIKIGIGIVVVAGLIFAYYTISPLFIQATLDEGSPTAIQHSDTKSYPVIGTSGHEASGTVSVFDTTEGQVIRYENFHTVNGPDLFVYLSKDLDADEFVNLGRLKATNGNINYSVPDGIDASEYKYIMVWCRAFGVLFNYAEIN